MKQKIYIGLCLLWMSTCPALHSQDKVTFQYDRAGNRISRTIVLSSKSAAASDKEERQAVYTEMISDIKIKIYPNPTAGMVKVEIQNLPEGQTANIRIYSMSGRLIATFKDASSVTGVNLSNQPVGVYVMEIVTGEHRTEWKIIKK